MNRKEFEEMYNVKTADATDTGCPFIRIIRVDCKECGNHGKVYYVAESQDPCPLKKCELPKCRNYGKKYDNPERLIIQS